MDTEISLNQVPPIQNSVARKGALLLNLGTPDSPSPSSVRAYLKEFLMDPYVIDIPFPLRWLLVHGAILPRRPAQSAQLYRKVWTDRGSPLLNHLEDLTEKVQSYFNHLDQSSPSRTRGEWIIAGAMRYGKPSIQSALTRFKAAGIDEILVVPLYPQYSLAATESSIHKCRTLFQSMFPHGKMSFVPPFYREPTLLMRLWK
jgi:ferrochelatase